MLEETKVKYSKLSTIYEELKISYQENKISLENEINELKESEKNLRFRFTKQLQEYENQSVDLNKLSKVTPSSSNDLRNHSPSISTKHNFDNISLPSGMSSSASFERMQSLIKQQESEIISLQEQLTRLESVKSSLEQQLVKLTTTNDK